MATLEDKPSPEWADVYEISTADPVLGGPIPVGVVNVPHAQLKERTEWLRANTLMRPDLDDHLADKAPHGAAVAATPNALALRDASGRTKVATPAATEDAANKAYVDARPAPKAGAATALTGAAYKITVQTGQTAAAGTTNTAAGAFGIFIAADAAATARTLVIRDADGRAQVAAPAADADAATKKYVDDAATAAKAYTDARPAPKAGAATALTGTAFKITVQTGQTAAAGTANTAAGAFGIFVAADAAATARTLVISDADGRAQVAAPSADADAATKKFVEDLVNEALLKARMTYKQLLVTTSGVLADPSGGRASEFRVTMVGGGGGGAMNASYRAGGGGGEGFHIRVPASAIDWTKAITIGAGGTAGNSVAAGAGGTTSWTGLPTYYPRTAAGGGAGAVGTLASV
jgi:hypothetical protein